MSGSRASWGGPFSDEALARSLLFDPSRALRGEQADALLAELTSEMPARQGRPLTSKRAGHGHFEATASVFLANLLIAAGNRIDNQRFVSISFSRADYAQNTLSVTAMTALRDHLLTHGYIEGQPGFRRSPEGGLKGGLEGQARRTRLRATPKLLDAFTRSGVYRDQVVWRLERQLIVMRSPCNGLAPEPNDVATSRRTLQRAIARIASSQVALPDDAWSRVISRYQTELYAGERNADERLLAGDMSATALYRVFKGDWNLGGRVYGGWWINLPKTERSNLTIEGDPVVELDYARLHPALLFARVGIELTFDPYELPGIEGPKVRDLGKRTFNRLINKTSLSADQNKLFLHPLEQDACALPKGVKFSSYLQRFIQRLAPIKAWFGTGEGMRLQREDSDLALSVLEILESQRIPVLPVHDSFIVRRVHENALREAMVAPFQQRYGFKPQIRPDQRSPGECLDRPSMP